MNNNARSNGYVFFHNLNQSLSNNYFARKREDQLIKTGMTRTP